MSEPLGLFGKYRVEKTDGTPIDPQARYFVLRLDTDAHAREAARRYAESVKRYNPILAKDIMNLLAELDGRIHDARFAETARRNGNGGSNGHGGAR